MKFNLKILELKSITEIPGYWTAEDYINILEACDFTDLKEASPSELKELLEMAISEMKPEESAAVVLTYKLGDKLSKGQIHNLSNEMLEDNQAEEYPDIAFHYPLFAINQLLHKAYNGVFPNAKAVKIEFEIVFADKPNRELTPELALLAISKVLTNKNPIVRLYEKELDAKKRFVDAEKIVWMLEKKEPNQYMLITSDYWMNKEDFNDDEISGNITLFED